jgi:hypothetical protein
MRVWIIALLSVVAAVAAAAALAAPGLRAVAASEIVPVLLMHSPALAVVALAGYALAALLLTTGTLVGDMIGLRGRVARLAEAGLATQHDIAAVFGPSRLARLASRFAPTAAPGMPIAAEAIAGTPENVRPGDVRSEIARLHYIWLARTQFFTALVLLAAAAAIGFVQDYAAPLIPLPGIIPTVWAFLALGGLVLLAGLSRLVIDVTVEPIVEEILRLPGERPETRLLRRMTELVEAARAPAPAAGRSETMPALRPVSDELLERLAMAVEESRRAWLESVADLSAAAAALRSTMHASAETLEASLHGALERLAAATPGETNAETFNPGTFIELQVAVERLTMAIERLGTTSEAPANETASAEAAPRRSGAADRIAAELAKLLREINAKP